MTAAGLIRLALTLAVAIGLLILFARTISGDYYGGCGLC